ncbi:MAG: efflux RND transporter periplasmic adaptor subunit [Alphaproteobacteria bacterium]|nr:efflux RND transporter periplasmic adaptor subunit [Alphaproteobacteria bacterium]
MILWLFAACSGGEVASTEPVVRPVRTEVVAEVGGALRGTFSGTAEAGDQTTLSFAVGGTVESIQVRVGERVTAGQELARLDDTQLRLQVEQAQAALAQASASRTLAKQTLDRAEALYLNGNASAADVEAARAQFDSARAQVSSASRQHALAKEQQANAVLTANRDGAVAKVLVETRENVGAGTPVVILTPEQELQVTVAVPSVWIDRLEEGDAATVRFPELSADPLPARITELSVTGQGSSFPVTVELAEMDPRVRPGMVAEVDLLVEETDERRIELPLSALAEDTTGRFVWVVDRTEGEQGKVRRVDITTGALTGEDRIVVEGVDSGAVVVTAGVSLLYAGRPVRLEAP